MNVSPLLGIEEPSLLLEGLNQRIAYLEHRFQEDRFANENLATGMALVLDSLRRERDDLMAAVATAARSQSPPPLLVRATGD